MTTPDPIDQLRDLAAQVLRERCRFRTPMAELSEKDRDEWRGHVDAVAVVLAAERSAGSHPRVRELSMQVRIGELEARVNLLAAALTEIAHNDQDPGYLLQRRAQLALSAGEEKPDAG
jgi:hypothetical protein